MTIPQAFAQDRSQRPWSLRSLFFPGQKARGESIQRPDAPRIKSKLPAPAPARKKQKQAIKPDVEPEIAIVPKAVGAKTILVVGDFIAAATAEGLNAIFASDPTVRILDRSNSSSGLVRDDHYDWPGKVAALVEAEKPAVVVMVVGANDRQQMRIGGKGVTLRSDAWTQEYTARAMNFASAIGQERVPLVWIGAPAFKSSKSTSDMLALNEIYRKVAADAGVEFVDVWDGFVDDDGKFAATGADVSGQSVRLRSGDGINLTTAGKRKLAFYSEKHLRKLLGPSDPASFPGSMAPESASLQPAAPLVASPKIDRTKPISLDDPALDGGNELLGGEFAPNVPSAGRLGVRPPVAGNLDRPVAGRADDFGVQQNGSAATTAIPWPEAASQEATPLRVAN